MFLPKAVVAIILLAPFFSQITNACEGKNSCLSPECPRAQLINFRKIEREFIKANKLIFNQADLKARRSIAFKALDPNNASAPYRYAEVLEEGIGGPVHLHEARRQYQISAARGYPLAQFVMGYRLLKGKHVEQDLYMARTYFDAAARQNHAPAQVMLGYMLYNGLGGPQDLEKARENLKISMNSLLFGPLTEKKHELKNKALEKDFPIDLLPQIKKANFKVLLAGSQINWFKFGLYIYAEMLQVGIGGPRDLPMAQKLFQVFRAYARFEADLGSAHDQYLYGNMLTRGLGGDANIKEAIRYFCMSAEQGHSGGQFSCGTLLIKNTYHTSQKQIGLHYLKLAADNEIPEAQIAYGMQLEYGTLTEKNLGLAIEYYDRALWNYYVIHKQRNEIITSRMVKLQHRIDNLKTKIESLTLPWEQAGATVVPPEKVEITDVQNIDSRGQKRKLEF